MTDAAAATPPPVPDRRIRVLWNPSSGRKAGLPTNHADEGLLTELMAKHGLGDDLRATTSEEDAIAQAKAAVKEGIEVVVAAGGDGTIGLVGRQLMGTDSALGMLPLGSVMNIPRMLEVPRDLDGAAEVLRTGRIRAIDVGETGGDVFYEAVSVGLHAAVSRELPKADEGDRAAIWRSIVAGFRYRPSRMTIELDGDATRTIATRALLVAIANGPYMGAGFTVAPDAQLDDGRFDVRIFRHFSKRELLLHFVSIAFGRRAYVPHVTTERAARVRITGARPLPARADARDLGTTPVEVGIRPAALHVVVPAPGDPAADVTPDASDP
ncbi:MAG: diacylglycerol kinase family protein [Chloroflexota bacterium]